MRDLGNNCKIGKVGISPKDWETGGKTLLGKEWVIHYRFYDSSGKVKQVWISSFNTFTTLESRRRELKKALADEMDLLINKGWNPYLGEFVSKVSESQISGAISPSTSIIAALTYAKDKAKCTREYKGEIKSCLKYIEQAAIALKSYQKPIGEVRRKDIKLLLEKCAEIKDEFSSKTFNRYKKNLSGLFSELVEMEVIEQNPCTGIKNLKTITEPRILLTPDQRKKINDFLFGYDINFWILLHIFFHSGSRTTEILKVKREHVDLDSQEVSYQILKGKNYSWVKRPIKDIALPYWQAAAWNCPVGHYLFGEALKPNLVPIHRSQIDRRWKRHIIDKLKINVSYYSLKHLNSTETENLVKGGASLQNMESQKMISGVYDIDSNKRQSDKVKKVNNPF